MKKMSQQDLDRLGKKKGFKVKRKMGAQQKKPEPEAEDIVALSGAELPEAPVPASDAFMPVMERMATILERMEAREIPAAAPAAVEPEPATVAEVPQPAEEPAAPASWSHKAKRDKKGHMDSIVSSDNLGNTWTHKVMRSEKKVIKQVVSKSNSGLKFIHTLQRDTRALISGATTTPA